MNPSSLTRLLVPVLSVPLVAIAGLPLVAPQASAAPVAASSVSRAASSSSCPSPGGVTVPEVKEPSGAEVVIHGHGWGHGMGMSQYGAQGAARLGCDYKKILTTYYRGSKVTSKTMDAPVRLALDSTARRATIAAADKSVTWKAGSDRAVQPAGVTWSVRPASKSGKAGAALVDDKGKVKLWRAKGSTLVAAHAGRTVRLRSYHASSSPYVDRTLRQGSLYLGRVGDTLDVYETIRGSGDHTAVQKYLWGLGEVPVSWPQQALRAQVVAARTFLAGKYDAKAKVYSIRVTTADQVYRGAAGEDNDKRYGSHWKAAVTATEGRVLVDGNGGLVTTMYSSSMGGHTESRAFVYGSQGGFGYLSAVDDSRWDAASDNPYRSWVKGYSKAAFAKKLGFRSVSKISVGERGTSARNKGVLVTGVRDGKTVTKAYTGAGFRSIFGLRSPGFVVGFGIGGPGAQALVGDWDGDGKTDTGWYRNPHVALHTAKGKLIRFRFDVPGATAVVADWDGNGRDSVSLFKDGKWYLRNGRTSASITTKLKFGTKGDLPVAGRWRKGAPDAPGLVRGKEWILRVSTTDGDRRRFTWGVGGTPAVGDWNGNGVDGPAVRNGAKWSLGADFPLTGSGWVKPPAVWTTSSYVKADGVVPAGMAKTGKTSATTIVRGTRFIWQAPGKDSVATTQVFGG